MCSPTTSNISLLLPLEDLTPDSELPICKTSFKSDENKFIDLYSIYKYILCLLPKIRTPHYSDPLTQVASLDEGECYQFVETIRIEQISLEPESSVLNRCTKPQYMVASVRIVSFYDVTVPI